MPRILIADDDEQVRRLLREILERAGHHVVEAADGEEALLACCQHRPDVLIIDLIMPRKEGLGTIIEAKQAHPAGKVIAISGGGRSGPDCYLQMARCLGAERALAKPFRPDELVQMVEDLLGEAAAQA